MGWSWVALIYASYLAVVSLARPQFARARLPAAVGVLAMAGMIVVIPAFTRPGALTGVILPTLCLLAGYKGSGLFFVRPDLSTESRLLAIDKRWLGATGVTGWFRRAPRAVTEYFELTYLLVYPAIPIGAVVLMTGDHVDGIDRYWAAVFTAAFASYSVLPWVQTRPPMLVEATGDPPRAGAVRRLNQFIAARASIRANTIPSGHAAAALAAALAIGAAMPVAGSMFLFLAISLTAASVLGRYHYALDSVLGVLVGIGAWLIVAR